MKHFPPMWDTPMANSTKSKRCGLTIPLAQAYGRDAQKIMWLLAQSPEMLVVHDHFGAPRNHAVGDLPGYGEPWSSGRSGSWKSMDLLRPGLKRHWQVSCRERILAGDYSSTLPSSMKAVTSRGNTRSRISMTFMSFPTGTSFSKPPGRNFWRCAPMVKSCGAMTPQR